MDTQTLALDGDGLLGRDHPISLLRAALGRTRTSHGGFVLVAGEAGIGKTTLVTRTLRATEPDGMLIASGTAWDGGAAPGYWPWIQLLRGLARTTPADVWTEGVDGTSDELRHLLDHRDAPLPDDADAATFQMYDAVARLLVTLSHHQPVVLVVEDLHWADTASLRLLEFVVRHTAFERVLVIGTYRDVEVMADGHPLRSVLPSLLPKATLLTLRGLEPDQVRVLIRRSTGREPDDRAVAEIQRRSAGNPFFVEQLASLWHGGGAIDEIPPGIQHVLERRLAPLSSTAVTLLTTAALLGREFDTAVLADASDVDDSAVATSLDEAVAGRLIVRHGDERAIFVHDLVRSSLIASLDAGTRRSRHLAIVQALSNCDDPDTEVVSALAHHAWHAIPGLPAEEAVGFLLAAADDASSRLSAHEVVCQYERALELLPADDPRRTELMLDLAGALAHGGQLVRARETYRRLLDETRSGGAERPFARAVLGLHELGLPDPDEDLAAELDLLHEAQERLADAGLPDTDPLVITLVVSAARAEAHGVGTPRSGEDPSLRAIELARRSGDDAVLGISLRAHHDVIWRPGTAGDRLALADEMITIATRRGDRDLGLHASLLRFVALLELGDPRAFEEHDVLERGAEASHASPRFSYLARSRAGALALLQGRFETAATAIDDAYALGQKLGEVDRVRLWLEQRWACAVLKGDLDAASRFIGRYRHELAPEAAPVVDAVTAAAAGHEELPRRHLEQVRAGADQYPGLFRPWLLQGLARLAVATGDVPSAEELREELTPLRDTWAVVAGASVVYGPYAFWLASIDARHGRWAEALDGFEHAIEMAERLGARPWIVEARLGMATALRDRGRRADAATVAELAQQVTDEARDLDMPLASRHAQDLLGTAPGQPTDAQPSGPAPTGHRGPTSPAGPDAERPRFRPDGEVWELVFDSRTVRLPATKGLADLHVLLRNRGADIPAVELLDPAGGPQVRNAAAMGGDPVLDDQARAAYRRRLEELDERIEAATARGHDDEAAELDTERQALLDELRTATGLGGRARRLGDEAERARKTVTARIRDTLRRLDEQHPELAEHLRATVATGAACSYRPTREIDWEL